MGLIQSRNPNFLRKKGVGPNFADWLAPDEHTNKDLLATAYWALIANMMSEMAKAIGNESRHNTLSRGRAEHSQCFSESLYQARRANLNGSPMDLGNLLNRSILPALNRCAVCGKPKEECRKAASKDSGATPDHNYERDKILAAWRGWHAARRGLGTNLYRLGVPEKTIQAILRHAMNQ